jgi:1-deoxy-D-xylulose-5-phosphate synthase
VFQEVALQKEDVILCLDRAGLVGQDGPTHMGLYDLAYLQAFPGMVLASPRDGLDIERMLQAALEHGGPWALRWPRGTALAAHATPANARPALDPGRAEKLREGEDGTVFALGAMVEPALQAAEDLASEGGPSLAVWDARFAKPLDREAILAAAAVGPWVATVEEHALAGGFGAAVAALLADAGIPCRLSRHGVGDHFVPHMSSRDEQLAALGLDAPGLAMAWRELAADHASTGRP